MKHKGEFDKESKQLWSALRKLRFKRANKSQARGILVVNYAKQIDERRTVTVQMWSDGLYRASSSFLGCSNTAPTVFTTLVGMKSAILHESTRMDGKYSSPGSVAGEKV